MLRLPLLAAIAASIVVFCIVINSSPSAGYLFRPGITEYSYIKSHWGLAASSAHGLLDGTPCTVYTYMNKAGVIVRVYVIDGYVYRIG